MPDNNKQSTPQSTRTTIVWTILMALIFLFIAWQFLGTGIQKEEKIDELAASEFTTAVEDGRVTEATFRAGENKIEGKYYPAQTAGASLVGAYDKAIEAVNNGAIGKPLSGSVIEDEDGQMIEGPTGTVEEIVATQKLESKTLGEERKYVTTWVGQDALQELMSSHPHVKYQVKLPNSTLEALLSFLPMLLMIGFFVFLFYQMSKANNTQMSFGKTKAKMATEERPDVKFADVAGVDEAVEEMQEVKDFLANPAKYQEIGAKIPRGCLLVGPPGTGKTLLARAVAGEAGVPFFSISGSDFVEMFVGVGASRVRDLFKQAKEAAPAIIFIDEIDAVGRQRGTGLGGGHDEREQTLNQLLVEMDGFEANDSVVLIAATNRSDVLDPALLRPGRFDRQIVVDVPDVKGREKILQVHAANKPLAQDVDLGTIAKLTPGFTGADLANLLNESALLTARRGKKVISMQEVTESMERVIAGPERKGRVMNEKTKRTIAYHESGHALVGHCLPLADPVQKISIVSRGRALGYTLSIPEEDKVLSGRNEMMQELAVFMGGRVAEEIFCDDITTGASNDLERATKMARQMVTNYGMSTDLGTQVFGEPNHEVFLGRDYGNTQDYSDDTARRIDAEVARIMKEAHDTAYDILSSRRSQMDLMAQVLLERETIDGDACQALLNNKWSEYLAYEQSDAGRAEIEKAATTVGNGVRVASDNDEPEDNLYTRVPSVPEGAENAHDIPDASRSSSNSGHIPARKRTAQGKPPEQVQDGSRSAQQPTMRGNHAGYPSTWRQGQSEQGTAKQPAKPRRQEQPQRVPRAEEQQQRTSRADGESVQRAPRAEEQSQRPTRAVDDQPQRPARASKEQSAENAPKQSNASDSYDDFDYYDVD